MTIQRKSPEPAEGLVGNEGHRGDYPADTGRAEKQRLPRQRRTDWRRRVLERDASVSHQLWDSLAQRLAGICYLAEAMSARMLLEDPAESQHAKRIAELSADAVREACQLARTLEPSACKRSMK